MASVHYFIKVTCKATENNDNFRGETQVFYRGRNNFVSEEKNFIGCEHIWAKESGYTTKAAAMRALKAQKELDEWETNKGFWSDTSEIVSYEV